MRVGGEFSNYAQVLSNMLKGSILKPILFLVYAADLKTKFRSPFAVYTDDIKLDNLSDNLMTLSQDLLEVY